MSVYAIQCRVTGRIKIGRSGSPRARFATIQGGSPTKLTLLGELVQIDYPQGRDAIFYQDERACVWFEAHCHEQLREHRLHGEWFNASPEVLAFLNARGICDAAPPNPEVVHGEVVQEVSELANRILSAVGA